MSETATFRIHWGVGARVIGIMNIAAGAFFLWLIQVAGLIALFPAVFLSAGGILLTFGRAEVAVQQQPTRLRLSWRLGPLRLSTRRPITEPHRVRLALEHTYRSGTAYTVRVMDAATNPRVWGYAFDHERALRLATGVATVLGVPVDDRTTRSR